MGSWCEIVKLDRLPDRHSLVIFGFVELHPQHRALSKLEDLGVVDRQVCLHCNTSALQGVVLWRHDLEIAVQLWVWQRISKYCA